LIERCGAQKTLGALAALALAGGAHAGPPQERTTPEVLVEGAAPAPLPEDPTSFTRVVEVKDFAGEGKQVEDLLETTPGVHVRRFGGPGGPSEISIRGSSGAQVVVLLDGVRLNSAQTGTVDLSTVPIELLERIEVTRGGGSLQTGSDAIGGVVNLVTKRASARPETHVTGSAGSFETWQGSLSQTGRLGDLEALVGYDYFKTSGDWEFDTIRSSVPDDTRSADRINNRSEHQSGLLKLARDFGDGIRAELSDQIFYSSEGRPGLDQPEGGVDRGQSEVGHSRRTRNVAQLRIQGGDLTPLGLSAELQAFHRFDRSRFRDESLDPAVDSDDRNSSYGGRADFSAGSRFGPLRVLPSVGSELRRDELNPEGTGFRSRRVLGVFAQCELGLFDDRLLVVPALRYDDTEDLDGEWIPRIGLRASPLPWLELRANAERSYRVPNFDELYLDGACASASSPPDRFDSSPSRRPASTTTSTTPSRGRT
jgi:outer membrane cobalamin receptor